MKRSIWHFAFTNLRDRRAGALRVLLYTLLCCLVVLSWGIHGVKAMAAEKARALGNEMMKLDVLDGEVNRIAINGETFRISISTIDNSVDDALTRFQSLCNLGHSLAADGWTSALKLDRKVKAQLAEIGLVPGSNAVRLGDGDSGTVLCFQRPEGAPPLHWMDALRTLAETGDTRPFGMVRYAFAKRTGEHTHLTLLWSDTPLNVNALISADSKNDVPGSDPTNIARPLEARRAFSAALPETPYSYNVYVSVREPSALFDAFDAQMQKDGWEIMLGATEDEPWQRVYMKPLIMVMVLAGQEEQGTVVSILESSKNEQLDRRTFAPAARSEP